MSTHEGHDIIILEGACANETSLVILDILDVFAQKFGVIYNSYIVYFIDSDQNNYAVIILTAVVFT